LGWIKTPAALAAVVPALLLARRAGLLPVPARRRRLGHCLQRQRA
jgi:hypothetical protein